MAVSKYGFQGCDSHLTSGTVTAEQQNTHTDSQSSHCDFSVNRHNMETVAHCTSMSSVQLCHEQVTHKHLTGY